MVYASMETTFLISHNSTKVLTCEVQQFTLAQSQASQAKRLGKVDTENLRKHSSRVMKNEQT